MGLVNSEDGVVSAPGGEGGGGEGSRGDGGGVEGGGGDGRNTCLWKFRELRVKPGCVNLWLVNSPGRLLVNPLGRCFLALALATWVHRDDEAQQGRKVAVLLRNVLGAELAARGHPALNSIHDKYSVGWIQGCEVTHTSPAPAPHQPLHPEPSTGMHAPCTSPARGLQ